MIHLVQLAVYPANAEVLLRKIQITEPFRNVRIRRRKHADPTVVPAGFRVAKIQTEIGVGVLIEHVAFFFAARSPLYFAKHVEIKRVSPVRALSAAVIFTDKPHGRDRLFIDLDNPRSAFRSRILRLDFVPHFHILPIVYIGPTPAVPPTSGYNPLPGVLLPQRRRKAVAPTHLAYRDTAE